MNKSNRINDFNLIPFYKNKFFSKKINSINKNIILKLKKEIFRIVKSCDAVLIHDCTDIMNFSGRDIDTFYISKKKLLNFDESKSILHKREKGSYRFLLNDTKSLGFINLDIEDINLFSSKTIKLNHEKFLTAMECKKTGLKHFDFNTLIFFKIVKYFSFGVLHSYEQLFRLKNLLNKLNKKDLNYILNLTSKYLKKEHPFIKMLIYNDFFSFERNQKVKKFWIEKRKIRQKKRKVYSGTLILKNLFKSKDFLYAFFLGKKAKWNKHHRPLPAIAIVGNDGSGKTSVINYIIKNYSKMDPAHISMRPDKPIIPFFGFLRKFIKKIIKKKFLKNFHRLKFSLLLIGQISDFLDRYIKYKVGIAWSDAGYGITIFERYVTDKLRGEFPNKVNKFLPIEQFFPLPDGIVYLDVLPKDSLVRKSNENHTLEELRNKRENYLSLLSEFSETKKIHFETNLNEKIKHIKNYIFKLSKIKRDRVKFQKKIQRCIWIKNRNRKLSGKIINRYQKDSFI